MNKAKLLKITNLTMFAVVLVQVSTGALIFLGKWHIIVGRLHKYNGLALVCLITAHIALNWGWIKINVFDE